ncbi:MAG TPA: conjugal transfer protein TrbC [Syntrophobacteraceae bacterium]|jgi:type IV secretion system protein TrbC|nr:conjugal transfer protein TrbC [Syntrophobacteraceae bacterium]
MFRRLRKVCGLGFSIVLYPLGVPHASSSSSSLPWESPLQKLVSSLSGPVALGIAIIAMVAAGGALVFGGELSEFTRKALLLVLAIAFLVLGSQFMTTLFSVSGAVF